MDFTGLLVLLQDDEEVSVDQDDEVSVDQDNG